MILHNESIAEIDCMKLRNDIYCIYSKCFKGFCLG